MLESGSKWSAPIGGLVAAAALMGGLNSLLQLARYKAQVGAVLVEQDWMLIGLWIGLLIVWSIVLGVVLGVYLARHWFSASPVASSMASSD